MLTTVLLQFTNLAFLVNSQLLVCRYSRYEAYYLTNL